MISEIVDFLSLSYQGLKVKLLKPLFYCSKTRTFMNFKKAFIAIILQYMFQQSDKFIMFSNNHIAEKQNKPSEEFNFSSFINNALSDNFQKIILDKAKQKIPIKDIMPHSQTYDDLIRYLTELVPCPSSQKAIFHRQSNRIGLSDTFKHRQNIEQSAEKTILNKQNCQCCGLARQEQQLDICGNSFRHVALIGISTYLFYRTMKNLISLLILSLLIFGLYALVTNIDRSTRADQVSSMEFNMYMKISLLSKMQLYIQQIQEQAHTQLIVQVWLGYAIVVAFFLSYILIERIQVTQVSQVEALNKSAADFTLVFKGVPMNTSKEQIQEQIKKILKQSENKLTQLKYNEQLEEIVQNQLVAKINVGVSKYEKSMMNYQTFQSLKDNIKKQQNQYKAQVVSWIMELTKNVKFITPKKERDQFQNKFNQFRAQNYMQNINKKKEILRRQSLQVDRTGLANTNQGQKKQGEMRAVKTDVFVTFESRKIKQNFLDVVKDSFLEKIRSELSFHLYRKKIQMAFQGNTYNVIVEQASQPQDVIWQNIGVKRKQIIIRKSIILLVTLFILAVSFVTIYGLSTIQYSQQNQYISVLISLSLSIFNLIIRISLKQLTKLQLDTTHTIYQSSLAFKTIIAQLINSIVIPILVNFFIKHQNYFQSLAEDIFFLALTNSFLSPILKILDPMFVYVKLIKVWWNERPSQIFFLSQKQLNQVYEFMEFQTGIEYVYLITLYLFTCFFMSLQPIIIIFAILGYIMNYWAQKYCLFRRCKRPVPGTRILYDSMVKFIYMGAAFYSVGSLLFLNLMPKIMYGSDNNQCLIGNLIAVGFSAFIICVPFSTNYDIMVKTKNSECQSQLFSQDRVFLPSDYDRMNPDTKKKAIKEYRAFMQGIKKDLKNKTPKEQKYFLQNLKRRDRIYISKKDQQELIKIIDDNYIPTKVLLNDLFGNKEMEKGGNEKIVEEKETREQEKETREKEKETREKEKETREKETLNESTLKFSFSEEMPNQSCHIIKQPHFDSQQSINQREHDNDDEYPRDE